MSPLRLDDRRPRPEGPDLLGPEAREGPEFPPRDGPEFPPREAPEFPPREPPPEPPPEFPLARAASNPASTGAT